LVLSRDTDLKACELDSQGRPGPVWSGKYQVDDVNPPSVVSVSSAPLVPVVEICFSKPVQPASARDVSHYVFATAGVPISSVQVSADGTQVTLRLAAPLPQAVPVKLEVRDIVEDSPRANVLKFSENAVDGLLPVYSVGPLHSPQESVSGPAAGLPTQPGEPWTINFFLRCDKAPPAYVLLGGFGEADDHNARMGMGRYFINFENGIAFWLAQEDLATPVKIDPNRWQMLTATYDGKMVTLYKDGNRIAAAPRSLSPDVAKVGVGIRDPWARGNQFEGEIRDFKIWRSALIPAAVQALQQNGPKS
jgi:hypothetical protein